MGFIKYRVEDVFVPGGMPEQTYINRANLELAQSVRRSSANKLITITGATKCGKTVLVRKLYPTDKSIWIDSGSIRSEDDFWNTILLRINGWNSTERSHSSETTIELGVQLESSDKPWNLLSWIGKLAADLRGTRAKSNSMTQGLQVSAHVAATEQLKKNRIPIIIDDFHYLHRDLQGKIIRALKPLIFDGLSVIIIAIPHRRYDAVRVEREITGRLENIEVPSWSLHELHQIGAKGFPLLRTKVSQSTLEKLAIEAFGSPHLMQEFCSGLAKRNNIYETLNREIDIDEVSDDLFKPIAQGTGKIIYDKLARGPRQRSDRKQRKLKDGTQEDIYTLTLLALASLHPGLDTINYESLRVAMKDILSNEEIIPQAHEVARVLKKMSEIAADDEASTAVLDWDDIENILHITDPFFAFYLKWGVMN